MSTKTGYLTASLPTARAFQFCHPRRRICSCLFICFIWDQNHCVSTSWKIGKISYGQVSLVCSVHLQTDNFCLFLCKQTDKQQPFARWANSKWTKKNWLGFRRYIYKYISKYILLFQYYTENGTHRKRQLSFVCCKQKKETENFHLFSANGKQNNRTLFSLVSRRQQ
jgi:hypothetical protein